MSTKPKEPKIKEIVIPVYYTNDKEGNVLIDEESIRQEFNTKLREALGISSLRQLVNGVIAFNNSC